MGRKRKAKKGGGGGRDQYTTFAATTVDSKTTHSKQTERNAMIDNENSDNSVNQTQENRQSLQKGGNAGSIREGVKEYHIPNFGDNAGAAMKAEAANNQLIAHAINDDKVTMAKNQDSTSV